MKYTKTQINPPKIFYQRGIPVPIHVIRERRRDSRISLLKDKVNIRLPRKLDDKKTEEQVQEFLKWAKHKIANSEYYDRQEIKIQNFNRIYTILDKKYEIRLAKTPLKSFKNIKQDHFIYVVIPESLMNSKQFSISKLKRQATNGMIKLFKKEFEQEVEELQNYARPLLKRSMTELRFNYTISKWGSCHSDGRVNLSSRLLYAPYFVRRYVILHELAHLVHMDHSIKFWNLVNELCPDYKEAKSYLKSNESKIDF